MARSTTAGAQVGGQRGVLEQPLQRRGDRVHVERIHQQGRVAGDLGQARGIRRQHRRARAHRLEHREAETFVERGIGERRAARIEGCEIVVVDVAEQLRARCRGGFEDRFVVPAARADEGQRVACAQRLRQSRPGRDQPLEVLAGLERSDGKDVGLVEPVAGRRVARRRGA